MSETFPASRLTSDHLDLTVTARASDGTTVTGPLRSFEHRRAWVHTAKADRGGWTPSSGPVPARAPLPLPVRVPRVKTLVMIGKVPLVMHDGDEVTIGGEGK